MDLNLWMSPEAWIDRWRGEAGAAPLRVLGIDLGTTNSTVAEITLKPGAEGTPRARCLEIEQSTLEGVYTHVLVPSVVAIYEGKTVVGEGAKRLRGRMAEAKSKLVRNRTIFWECKNEIGLGKTYHLAPEGFRNAAEIGGKVLAFLCKEADAGGVPMPERTVVTVPASFRAGQRRATLEAAEAAGVAVQGGDLLDEPIAAFIDYLMTHKPDDLFDPGKAKNLIVFDFGGGTCDVAVFRVLNTGEGPFEITSLAVSRYHRLGGGDIDSAILHEILIPQLLEQNGLQPGDLDYDDKKGAVEPAYLSLAEALKVGLCIEIRTRMAFGKYDPDQAESVVKIQPGSHPCKLRDGRELRLQSPKINAAQFNTVLAPFLDRDFVFHRETEYSMTCSIFAPLKDAIDRADLKAESVALCLMVGGSCLIPQIAKAVSAFLGNAQILTYEDINDIQTAVARGAAWHSLALKLTGEGLVAPVAGDSVAIRTKSGPMELIPRGARLPFPKDEWGMNTELHVPAKERGGKIQMRVELIGGGDRPIFDEVWEMSESVRPGERLTLQYIMDENQVLDFRLDAESGHGAEGFRGRIENPFTHISDPNSQRVKLEELEELIRTANVPREERIRLLGEAADLNAKLGFREKALFGFGRLYEATQNPYYLNRMGMIADEMKEYVKSEKYYREASRQTGWSVPLFNLALSYKNRRMHDQANAALDEAIEAEEDAPYLVLRAMLADSQGKPERREQALNEAMAKSDPVSTLDDWHLYWFETGAKMAGDDARLKMAEEERRRRKMTDPVDGVKGNLPERLGEAE